MNRSNWTEDMDSILKADLANGDSAGLIAKKIGVTRNAVLGRTYRLGLCKTHKGKRRPLKLKNGRKYPNRVNPHEYVDDIMDMRDMGYQWNDISNELGLTLQKTREIAIVYGGYEPKQAHHFTSEDIKYLIEAWKQHVMVEEMADKLGRTFGVISQKIHQMQKAGLLKDFVRDPAKTRLLRQYGEKALVAGATPQEALHAITEAKQRVFAEAMKAARYAAGNHRYRAIEKMNADIAAGVDRNLAIFTARTEGAHLLEIAEQFDPPLTRERVRQICFRQAEKIALKKIVGEE